MVQKRTFYEWSARVPLILRFPDQWKAGTVVDAPVSLIDLLPTFLDLVGVPDENRLPYDGRSLIGLLDGSDSENWVAFSENASDSMVEAPCVMLRQDRFKYVYIHGYEDQLFDLIEDPGEWHNLVSDPDHAEIGQSMKSRILEVVDPDEVAARVEASYQRRMMIQEAMERNGTSWDPEPRFDPNQDHLNQYLP
jgi:choline-sulfatase